MIPSDDGSSSTGGIPSPSLSNVPNDIDWSIHFNAHTKHKTHGWIHFAIRINVVSSSSSCEFVQNSISSIFFCRMAFLLCFSSLSTSTAHNSDFFFLLQSNLFLLIKYVEHGDAGDHLIEQLPQSFDKRFDSNSVLTNGFSPSIYHCSGVWPRETTIDTVTKKVFAITI